MLRSVRLAVGVVVRLVAGHLPHLEHTAAVNERLFAFLAAHPSP